MRPLELLLSGFTSFRGEQRLSFEELDLFAITGPTGAGKSSLLDAMTFALYGHTLRVGKQDAELVSQGATEMKVQLTFQVRGEAYRITRTWRFRPSTPDVKVLFEKRLEDGRFEILETKDRAVQKAVETILGMDFDTFTRVILLPQGKFDEFLKGDAPKRRELLRQLGGHEVFERMRAEAAVRLKVAKGEREGLMAQLDGHSAPSPEELAARTERLSLVEAALPGLSDLARKAGQALDEEEALGKQLARLAELRGGLATLAAGEADVVALRDRLAAAQQADRLQGPFARLDEARKQATTAADTLSEARVRVSDASATQVRTGADFSSAQVRVADAEPALAARAERHASARALDEQRVAFAEEAAAAERALAEREKLVASAAAALAAAERQAGAARGAAAKAEATLAASPPAGPRLAALNDLGTVLGEWNGLVKQAKEAGRKLREAETQRDAAQSALAAAAGGVVAAATAHAAAVLGLETARAGRVAAREAHEAARTAHARERLAHQAIALRAELHAGDACPVCAGEYPGEEHLPPAEDAARALATAAKAEREAAAAEKAAELAERGAEQAERTADTALRSAQQAPLREEAALAGWVRTVDEAAQVRTAAIEAGSALRLRLNEALGSTEWVVEELEAERQALRAAQQAHEAALAARQRLEAGCREADQGLALATQAAADAQAGLAAAAETRTRQAGRVSALDDQLRLLTGGLAVPAFGAAINAERQTLAAMLATAERAAAEAVAQAAARAEALHTAEAGQVAADARLAQDQVAWAEALVAAGLDEAGFQAAQASPEDQAEWRATVDCHTAEAVRLSALVTEVQAAVGERTTDQAAIAARREAFSAAETGLREAQSEAAEARAWLQQAAAARTAQAALVARHDAARDREQVYATLARDLRATDFQAYLLEHLQAELVDRATVLLRELSDGRYALVMRDAEFWIADNWNGGETRRVRTLSGGETFAASLAMALALSERLSQGAELGSLFLDEGFGTLDPETLESVTQVLESLRQRHRMIGVITHVRSLGERLPTQVRVTKSPGGSQIQVEAL